MGNAAERMIIKSKARRAPPFGKMEDDVLRLVETRNKQRQHGSCNFIIFDQKYIAGQEDAKILQDAAIDFVFLLPFHIVVMLSGSGEKTTRVFFRQ